MENEYRMVEEEVDKETEQLEEEELETAVEDEDEDEEPEVVTLGQSLYEYMRSQDLANDGDWEDIVSLIQQKWEKAAAYLQYEP